MKKRLRINELFFFFLPVLPWKAEPGVRKPIPGRPVPVWGPLGFFFLE